MITTYGFGGGGAITTLGFGGVLESTTVKKFGPAPLPDTIRKRRINKSKEYQFYAEILKQSTLIEYNTYLGNILSVNNKTFNLMNQIESENFEKKYDFFTPELFINYTSHYDVKRGFECDGKKLFKLNSNILTTSSNYYTIKSKKDRKRIYCLIEELLSN
jgi:hypothetical protein